MLAGIITNQTEQMMTYISFELLLVAGMAAQELIDHRTILQHWLEFGFGPAGRAI